jgi:hypothetical protein
MSWCFPSHYCCRPEIHAAAHQQLNLLPILFRTGLRHAVQRKLHRVNLALVRHPWHYVPVLNLLLVVKTVIRIVNRPATLEFALKWYDRAQRQLRLLQQELVHVLLSLYTLRHLSGGRGLARHQGSSDLDLIYRNLLYPPVQTLYYFQAVLDVLVRRLGKQRLLDLLRLRLRSQHLL